MNNLLRNLILSPKRAFSSSVPSVHQQIAGRQRFYKKVEVAASLDAQGNKQYGILLDGRSLKTPARNALYFQNYYIAAIVAAEWDGQSDKRKGIQPATMPFMSIASTTIDNISLDSLHARNTCLSFLPTDSALFWTSEDNLLYKKQESSFQPIIDWLEKEFNTKLFTSDNMTIRLNHPEESTRKMRAIVDSLVRYYSKPPL